MALDLDPPYGENTDRDGSVSFFRVRKADISMVTKGEFFLRPQLSVRALSILKLIETKTTVRMGRHSVI